MRRAGAALALLLLGACGGATAGAGPAAQAVTTTTPPLVTPTAAPTTTTLAPTTTTLAPTTTVDQRAKVIADFDSTLAAFNVCMANPAVCDVSSVAAPGSARFTQLADLFVKLAEHGVRGRPSDQDYTDFEDVEIGADPATATLKTCMVDAGVMYDTRGNDDPSDDVVINDALASTRTTWTLKLISGGWRQASADVISVKRGENQCPPRGS